MTKTDALKERYQEVLGRIDAAAKRSGRHGKDVMLVAVSKYAEIDSIRELAAMGHRDFGENHVQSILQRSAVMSEWWDRAKTLPSSVKAPTAGPVRWHMVGSLQRNKTRKAVELCRLIHSADNLRVLEDIQAAANKLELTADVLLQVNTSGEASKSGCAPAAALHLIDMVSTMINVRVRGMMTMAPHSENPEDARPAFARLYELFQEARRDGVGGPDFNIVSMGMSGDYEVAIEEGANLVRVGAAIFGEHANVPEGEEADHE